MSLGVTCSNCGTALDEPTGIAVEDRQRCPNCGSTQRANHQKIEDTGIEIHDQLVVKASHPDSRKPFLESKRGDELYRKTGEWNKLERTIDRENDRYTEKITDSDGNTIIEQDEPLSEHRGHGSAKKRND